MSSILNSEVFYSEWFNREVALYSIVQYICTCVYVPTAFTYVHMYIRTCVFMQKEESDTQAAPGLFLEWRQRKVCQATLRITFFSSCTQSGHMVIVL